MMPAVSLRTRLTVVHAALLFGAIAILGALPLLIVKSVQHAGAGGPPTVTHPAAHLYREIFSSGTGLTVISVMAVLSVLFGWLIAGRLLRPLRGITTTATNISASDLSQRLRPGKRDDEFARLSRTLNDLFARLEAAFVSQRHFVANASHELRTPLTAERAVLQVALADPDATSEALRSACEKVLHLGDQQERLLDALLTLASSERGLERHEQADLGDIAATIVRDRTTTAEQQEIQLVTELGAAPMTCDPALIESLVTNLVDNALRFNFPGGWVNVMTTTADTCAVISVRNSGPNIPADQIDFLFEPFRRLGDSRARREEGHGLGLAIVRAIAATHGAALTAAAGSEGGLDITIAFAAQRYGSR